MHTLRWTALFVLITASCQSYSPDPVDLDAHGRAFAERLPDEQLVRAFATTLRTPDAAAEELDLGDGISLAEARYVALLFNHELREKRRRAGVARAAADEAGRWQDPELGGSFAYILEQAVQYPWLVGGSLSLTLPITGRPQLEKELAEGVHAKGMLEAHVAEAHVLDQLDVAWVQWSAAKQSAALLGDLVAKLTELERLAQQLASAHSLTQIEARTFTLARVARQAERMLADNTVVTAQLRIQELLGMPPDRALALTPTMKVEPRVATPAQRRPLLLQSPQVLLAQHEHDIAEHSLALAVRKQWPELTLTPGWQEEDAEPRAALGFSLPLPLWNGNAREIAEARARRTADGEALRGALEHTTHSLARCEADLGAASRRRQTIEEQLLPLAAQQIADAKSLAELGQLDTLLLLDAVTRAYEAQLTAVAAAVAEAQATADLNSLFWPTLTPTAKER